MDDVVDTPVAQEVVAEPTIDQNAPITAEPEVTPEKPKDEPIPKGVQKRIDRAVRQKYEAEARANELERRLQQLEQSHVAKPAGSDAPRYEDFNNDFDAYSRAVARYEAKQEIESTISAHQKAASERQAQEAQAKSSETWAKRAAAAKAEMPDWSEVVESAQDIVLDPGAYQAIQESEVGPKIAYYLASNPDEADDIAQLRGAAAIRAIGRLEAKLEDGKVSVTRTPAPIKPVGQKAKVDKAPEEMSPAEFAKWRKGFISQRGSR